MGGLKDRGKYGRMIHESSVETWMAMDGYGWKEREDGRRVDGVRGQSGRKKWPLVSS